MEYYLKFKNGRGCTIECEETGTPLQDKINRAEERYGSPVATINGKAVKEHGLGGFILGSIIGGAFASNMGKTTVNKRSSKTTTTSKNTSSSKSARAKDRKYVNADEDYETRYSKDKPARKGYANRDVMNLETMAKGGNIGGYSKIDLVVKKPSGDEEIEVAKFKRTGDAIISANALGKNAPKNYEYYVSSTKKYAKGGGVGKTAEEVWNGWSLEQRKHFLKDNLVLSGIASDHRASLYRYDELPNDLLSKIKARLTEHISEGQFAKGGLTAYFEIKKEKDKMYDTALEKHGVFFAFSNDQFEKSKTPLKEGEKYISLGKGTYMPEGNYPAFEKELEAIDEIISKKIKDKKLKESEILYELQNHEAFYTYDISDVVELFEGTYTEKEIKAVFDKYKNKYAKGGGVDGNMLINKEDGSEIVGIESKEHESSLDEWYKRPTNYDESRNPEYISRVFNSGKAYLYNFFDKYGNQYEYDELVENNKKMAKGGGVGEIKVGNLVIGSSTSRIPAKEIGEVIKINGDEAVIDWYFGHGRSKTHKISELMFAGKGADAFAKGGGVGSSSSKSARAKDRKYVNATEDYEIRYSKDKPARKGYANSKYADGGIITFDDGFEFAEVSEEYARNNWQTERIFAIDLDSQTERVIEAESDIDDFDQFGLSLGFKDTFAKGGGVRTEGEPRWWKKQVRPYEFFVFNTETNKIWAGNEYEGDAKDELKEFLLDNPKLPLKVLTKRAITNKKIDPVAYESWARSSEQMKAMTKFADGGYVGTGGTMDSSMGDAPTIGGTMDSSMYAKGGEVAKGFKVFNYTDNLYASDEVFKTKKLANDYIKEFRNRFAKQGYYRDNRMRKIAIKDIDLLAIPSDFNPFRQYAEGGKVESKELIESEIFYINEPDDFDKAIDKLISQINERLTQRGISIITTKEEFDKDSDFPKRVFVDNDTTIRIWETILTDLGVEFRVSVFRDVPTMALGGGLPIPRSLKFTENDFEKLKASKLFNILNDGSYYDDSSYTIYDSTSTTSSIKMKRRGIYFKPEQELVIVGLNNMKNPLVKWLHENNIKRKAYAKGGLSEHGLKEGDYILNDLSKHDDKAGKDKITVIDKNDRSPHLVNLAKGIRYAKGGSTGLQVYNLGGDRYDGGVFWQVRENGNVIAEGDIVGDSGFEFQGKRYEGLVDLAKQLNAPLYNVEADEVYQPEELSNGGGIYEDPLDLERHALQYLQENYPDYTDAKVGDTSDEEYNDIFLEMVDDVREKFGLGEDNESFANEIVEHYMSSGKYATGGLVGKDIVYNYYGEQKIGTITEILPSGDYVVHSGMAQRSVNPSDVISEMETKKKRFGFFKSGGLSDTPKKGYHESKYLTKEQWERWNEYVKTGKIDGKKENNMFAVAKWVGSSVAKINAYEIEQRSKKRKMRTGGSTSDQYNVSIDWEQNKPKLKYGRKFFKNIYADSNEEAEKTATDQWNSVKENSNKKVLLINSINITELRKKPILDKPERKMATGGSMYSEGGSIEDYSEYLNYLEGEDLETMKAFIESKSSKRVIGKDRYGNDVRIGDAIHIRILTGRYGQTKDYEGIVTDYDKFGNVELDGQRKVIYTANYVYNDYEHGHHIWAEKIDPKDIRDSLRVPKKFIPTFSSREDVNGEKIAFKGTEKEFRDYLDSKFPGNVFGQWFGLYNLGWRIDGDNYFSPNQKKYTGFSFYQSVEEGQGYLHTLLIPKSEKRSKNEKMAKGGVTYPDLSKEKPDDIIQDQGTLFEVEPKSKESITKIPEVDITIEKNEFFKNLPKVNSSESAVNILRKFWDKAQINVQEYFYVLLLSQSNRPISVYHQSKGGVASTIADVELTCAVAVKSLARAVIVAHNHPSGELRFSDADRQLTKKLATALKTLDIVLLDSMIITDEGYLSMADEGQLIKL
jgi:hypothetical protein